MRDTLAQNSYSLPHNIPPELYSDVQPNAVSPGKLQRSVSPFGGPSSLRESIAASPFGTLNVPGNVLLANPGRSTPPLFNTGYHPPPSGTTSPRTSQSVPPLSITSPNPFGYHSQTTPTASNVNPGDFLHPPTSSIFERRTSVSAESIAVDSASTPPLPVYPKTADQLRRIKASIKNNFIFRDLDEEQERGVLNAMRELQVKKNEVVIRQGDVGEYFYVVESGLLHCYKRPEPLQDDWDDNATVGVVDLEEDMSHVDYHRVFGQKVAVCKPGNSFGELALMYGHNRKATVMAIEPSTLWSLDRITFRTIILNVAHRRRTMYEKFLSTVTLLTPLDAQERSKIADALISRVYDDGQVVVRQGETGDTFFFIEEGEAVVTKVHDEETAREIKVGTLGKGDYFGELSLLRLAPRAATVSAVSRRDGSQAKLKVAALDAHAFTRLLGPLRDIMERRAGTYPS
ncbi:Cyclic nucleotide-binding-like protein [Amanita muscaria]